MRDSHKRSLAKALSWRTTGTIDTFLISLLVTGHAGTAGSIAVAEVATKITLFYLHERVWSRIRFGLDGQEGHRRSLLKAVSWRATGTLDTFLLSWLLTGHLASAGAIAATEVLTKVVLYYVHERVWARIRWGRVAVPDAAGPTGAPDPITTAAAPVRA